MDQERLLENIQHINSKFSDESWAKGQNGNVLSYTAIKLAAMKAYLIDVKVEAHRAVMDAEIDMETQKGLAYLKMKEEHNATAAADAKNTVEEYIEAKKAYAEKKVFHDRLRSVVADTHDLIEALRSRIIDLQSTRKDEQIR